MKYALRTRFGRDIVAQFTPPSRPTKKNRVVILCDGMPTAPGKQGVMDFFSRKGYWVIYPRYRGCWESGGSFLKESPDADIGIVMDQMAKGFTDAWSGDTYAIANPEITLVASSFGGATALLASRDVRVKKVIAFSPVVDWTSDSKTEPMDFLARFTREGFGQAYRGAASIWKKLEKGDFFNPVRHAKEIDGSKIFMVHAKDDESVLWRPVEKFAKQTRAQFLLLKKGGHMGLSAVMEPRFWKRIKKFITL